MKVLKIILLSLVALVILLLLVALLLPSQYHIERNANIGAPSGGVFMQVADLSQWEQWSPWKDLDPKTVYTFTGTHGAVGSVWSWKSDVAGSGSMTLKSVEPGKSLRFALRFIAPNQMESEFIWTFAEVPGGTRAVWAMEGALSYPLERWMGLFFDGMMGPDFEKGLARLKMRAEHAPAPAAAP
jgi:hypothetical protein